MKQSTNPVALDQERDRVIAVLTEGFAQGDLDEDDLEDRLERVEKATELVTMRQAIADLEPQPDGLQAGRSTSTALVPAAPTAVADPSQVVDNHRLVAILSENTRRGIWTAAKKETVVSVMGNALLDFRDARLPPGVTTIHVRAVMADVTIIVPPGLPVENSCVPILGSVELDRGVRGNEDSTPRLRLTGVVVMASASVQQQPPEPTPGASPGEEESNAAPPRLGLIQK